MELPIRRGYAMTATVADLELQARLLTEQCLWRWEIVDRRDGDSVVRSSWGGEWMAYESREAALSAGRRRLLELLHGGADQPQPVSGSDKGDTA